MQADESGAPWPYDDVEPAPDDEAKPTWECPGGDCQCHAPKGEAEQDDHKVLFFDGAAKRMPGARCRVIEDGRLANKDAPYADGQGSVAVKLRKGSRVLELEWAPASLPTEPGYPYRKQYYLDLGDDRDTGVHRRLHNLGFSHHPSLAENIKDYQRTYLRKPTGEPGDVAVELAAFHDDGLLPPVPKSAGNAAPGTRSSLVGDDTAGAPPAAGGAGGPAPAGGKKPQGAAAPIENTKLRVHVRSRAGRNLTGVNDERVEVTIDSGQFKETKETDRNGFATFTLTRDDVDKTQPPGWVTVKVKRKHHGPDPGPGISPTVTTGEFNEQVKLEPPTFALEQPLMLPTHAGMPNILVDKDGRFLDVVMMDAGLNRHAASPMTPTRRLIADEYQRELMHHHVTGDITLRPGSEFQFDHDPASGDLDPCTANCKIRSPLHDRRVALKTAEIAGVAFFMLVEGERWTVGRPDANDVIPGQRFLRDKFRYASTSLEALDQQHVVGLVRLCQALRARHDIAAIYTIGVNGDTSRGDCHGYGLALDFGGCATSLPAPDALTKKGTQFLSLRLGVDFEVFFHWGRVPMWDPETVAANPGNTSAWKRFPETNMDDGTNYEVPPPPGKKRQLHYRLDPAPYQEPVPAGTDAILAAELAKVAPHFQKAREVFEFVYDFAVAEYNDSNDKMGRLPQGVTDTRTPIDSHDGNFILHPDYPKPNLPTKKNGRQAHVNHHHFQLGPTNYKDAAGTEIPRTT